jgi:hypothetical protein
VKGLIACLAVVLAVVCAGCSGDLAKVSGTDAGTFSDHSALFSLEAGDQVSVVYSVLPADSSRRAYISVSMDGADGLTSDDIVTTASSDADGLSWTIGESGKYLIVARGRNMAYEVSLSKP